MCSIILFIVAFTSYLQIVRWRGTSPIQFQCKNGMYVWEHLCACWPYFAFVCLFDCLIEQQSVLNIWNAINMRLKLRNWSNKWHQNRFVTKWCMRWPQELNRITTFCTLWSLTTTECDVLFQLQQIECKTIGKSQIGIDIIERTSNENLRNAVDFLVNNLIGLHLLVVSIWTNELQFSEIAQTSAQNGILFRLQSVCRNIGSSVQL